MHATARVVSFCASQLVIGQVGLGDLVIGYGDSVIQPQILLIFNWRIGTLIRYPELAHRALLATLAYYC